MYRKGDVVVIKGWNDLVGEFGVNEYGDITCDVAFSSDMSCMCYKEILVEEDSSFVLGSYIDNGTEYLVSDEEGYIITTDMVKLAV